MKITMSQRSKNRFVRTPEHDRKGEGKYVALPQAWKDTLSGRTHYTHFGFDPNVERSWRRVLVNFQPDYCPGCGSPLRDSSIVAMDAESARDMENDDMAERIEFESGESEICLHCGIIYAFIDTELLLQVARAFTDMEKI